MKRLLLIPAAYLITFAAQATTLTWPGSAPCDTTLQACVNGAAVNDTILISSGAGEVTTPLLVNKPLIIKSAPTARARFRNTTIEIQSSFAGPGNLNVLENVQLIETPLLLRMGTNEPADEHTIELNQLDVLGPAGLPTAIGIAALQQSSVKTVRIRNLRFAGGFGVSTSGQPPSLALEISDSQFINTVNGVPIGLTLSHSSSVKLVRNRVESLRGAPGICVSMQAISGATVTADLDRNVIIGCEVGISQIAQDGALGLTSRIRNNTIRSKLFGIDITGATATATIDNNIFTRIGTNAVATFEMPTIFMAHNLYHQTAQPAIAETNPITGDPQFVSQYDLHLNASSPAINAALAASIPAGGDFDSVTSTLPTIGAYNYHFGGAEVHLATTENSASNITTIPDTISRPFSEVMVQSIVEGFPLPAWAPNHLGVYTTSSAPLRTVIFSQNQQSIAPPRRFFVLDSNRHQTLSHTADASNISNNLTYLNWAPLNGNLFAKPIVTQRAIPLGGVVNNHPIGVWYDVLNARWAIFNADQTAMPQGALFDVTLANDGAPYAFTAPAANSTSLDLIMDHPMLNNTPCAAVLVTPVYQGVYVPSAVHLRYRPTTHDGGRWTVLRGDGNLFQNNMDMNVYVDPTRSRACLSDGLFASGLE
ncbi:DUF7452 domain-containing protein [Ahniella affigens]|nr:hypothetical protein [Ahniella affigens]